MSPFFADSHLDHLYKGVGAPLRDYLSAYANRFQAARLATDVLWIEKEVFPRLPALFDQSVMKRARRTIVDLDDAWFLRYENTPGSAHSKMNGIFHCADTVTVANDFLAQAVQERGGRNIHVVPQGIDITRYKAVPRRDGPVRIGWIGTPLNAEEYLTPLVDVLNGITQDMNAEILLVGAGKAVPGLQAKRHDWSEDTEIADLQDFDIGIMPLTDTLWNRCKSGYKLLQTMACGRLPIGAQVGYNEVLIQHGHNGLLVAPEDMKGWNDTLRQAVSDETLRDNLGGQAMKHIHAHFDVTDIRRQRMSALFD